MTGVFAEVMGADFERLHPMLRRRFGVWLEPGYACVGQGIVTSVGRGPWWIGLLGRLTRAREVRMPDVGDEVPFTVLTYAHPSSRSARESFDREGVSFRREYRIGRRLRRFDATMVVSQGRLVDHLGTPSRVAVDLVARALDDGSLRITSHGQRLSPSPLGIRLPPLLVGQVTLDERYDDATDTFHVRLAVRHRLLGLLFGYEGDFRCDDLQEGDAAAAEPEPGRRCPEPRS